MSGNGSVKGVALVTAIGSFSAPVAISSLRKMGLSVVGCDIYPARWLASAGDVDAFYQVPLASDRDAYLAAVEAIVRRESVDVILPSTDFEVDALRGRRESTGATVCMSSDDVLGVCRDKYLSYQALRESVDQRHLIPTRLVCDVDLDALSYPAIVKPVDGRSSSGLLAAESAADVRHHVGCADLGRYCIQPKLSGRVVTVDVLRHGDMVVALPRRELLRTLNGAGTSVEVFADEALQDLCGSIAHCLGVEGCVNFEFLEQEDGGYRFIECNPRLSGGVAFSVMSGYDFVANHVRHFLGMQVETELRIQSQYIARRYVECVTTENEGVVARAL